jgi:hypothetical protein
MNHDPSSPRRKALVYVAGPISKGDVISNVCDAHNAGMALLKAGFAAIVPHGSVFWGNRLLFTKTDGFTFIPEAQPAGTTHADWMGMDLAIVERCDAVLRLPGESKGADMETAHAKAHGVPVYHSLAALTAAYAGGEGVSVG